MFVTLAQKLLPSKKRAFNSKFLVMMCFLTSEQCDTYCWMYNQFSSKHLNLYAISLKFSFHFSITAKPKFPHSLQNFGMLLANDRQSFHWVFWSWKFRLPNNMNRWIFYTRYLILEELGHANGIWFVIVCKFVIGYTLRTMIHANMYRS